MQTIITDNWILIQSGQTNCDIDFAVVRNMDLLDIIVLDKKYSLCLNDSYVMYEGCKFNVIFKNDIEFDDLCAVATYFQKYALWLGNSEINLYTVLRAFCI